MLALWLPQYDRLKLTGASARSASYTGYHAALDRPVVIRVIPGSTPEAAAAFLMRLRQYVRIVDSRIATIHDFGQTEAGPLYVVTEAMTGQTIRSLIHKRDLTPKRSYQLSLLICEALQAVHDRGMAHGAMSSRTVWVTPQGQIKLAGAGMVQTSGGELSWTDTAYKDMPSDIAAVGRLIHEMFTGRLPGDRISSVLPEPFAEVIRRCLSTTQPYARPKDVQNALAAALRAAKPAAVATPPKRSVGIPLKQPPLIQPPAALKNAALPPQATIPQKQLTAPAAKEKEPDPDSLPFAPPPPPFSKAPPRHAPPPARKPAGKGIADFIFGSIRTILHLSITGGAVALVIAAYMLRGRIIIEEVPDDSPSTRTEVVEVRAPPPSPQMPLGLGPLPAAPLLGVAPASPEKIRTLTPASAPAIPALSAQEELDAQYREAVQRETAFALENVKLDDLPHYQTELQRLQAGAGVPETDAPDTPARLRQLREIYRQQKLKNQTTIRKP